MRRWGRFVYRRRKAVLVVSLLCFVLSIVGLLTGGQPINASDYNVESVQAANLESAQLPSTTGSSFTLILTSSQLTYGEPQFESDGQQCAGAVAQRLPCECARPHRSPSRRRSLR